MRKARWMLIGAIIACPIAVALTLVITNRAPIRETSRVPEPAPPAPVAPVTPAPPAIEPPGPAKPIRRIELIDSRGSGWLVDARFRYHGRFLDCWVVCESGEFRHVESRMAQEIAAEIWRYDRGPELPSEITKPVTGHISATLALPVSANNSRCVFEATFSKGGGFYTYLQEAPLPRRWFGQSTTERATPDTLGSILPGQTVRLYQHIHGRYASGLSDGHWLTRLYFNHTDESDGIGRFQYDIPLSQMNCRSPVLRKPAAWTAAWMLAGTGPLQSPLPAVVPYHEFLEAYAPYVRLAVYARFLTDADIAQLRAAANEGRHGNQQFDGERELMKLIESFRTNPDSWRGRKDKEW